MKKQLVGLAAILLFGGMVSPATASPYLAAAFGLVVVSDTTLTTNSSAQEVSMDPGFGFLASVGNSFDSLRAEVEMAYRRNDLKSSSGGAVKSSITSASVLGNLLVDIDLSESLRPFIGAGMGLAQVQMENAGAGSVDDTVLAYQVLAGLGLPLSPVTTLDLQYRFFATADPNFSGVKAQYQSNNFFAGLRFDF